MATVTITVRCSYCNHEFKTDVALPEKVEQKAFDPTDVIFNALPATNTFVTCENPQCQKPFIVPISNLS